MHRRVPTTLGAQASRNDQFCLLCAKKAGFGRIWLDSLALCKDTRKSYVFFRAAVVRARIDLALAGSAVDAYLYPHSSPEQFGAR